MANVIIDYSRLHGMIRPYPELCQMYWHLRYCRDWDESGRVKWYRRIRKEKKRLILDGHHPEFIRLLCRHLANPRNLSPLARLLGCRNGPAS